MTTRKTEKPKPVKQWAIIDKHGELARSPGRLLIIENTKREASYWKGYTPIRVLVTPV